MHYNGSVFFKPKFMPYRLNDDIMKELSSRQVSEEEGWELFFNILNERTEEEKINETEMVKLQRKYLYAEDDNDFILKEKRYLAIISPRENITYEERKSLWIVDPWIPEERRKLFKKISSEYLRARDKNQSNISKDNRLKYYKIYFLWNLWHADVQIENVDSIVGRHGDSSKERTLVSSPKTWIWMLEAEKYLFATNWDVKSALENICRDRWLKNPYDSINFVWNTNTAFNSFFRRFDDNTRKWINKAAVLIFAVIMLVLLGIILNAQYHFFR
jgi:hypothetical protein